MSSFFGHNCISLFKLLVTGAFGNDDVHEVPGRNWRCYAQKASLLNYRW